MDSSWLCKRLALEDAWLLVKKGFMRSVVITQGDVEACGAVASLPPQASEALLGIAEESHSIYDDMPMGIPTVS